MDENSELRNELKKVKAEKDDVTMKYEKMVKDMNMRSSEREEYTQKVNELRERLQACSVLNDTVQEQKVNLVSLFSLFLT